MDKKAGALGVAAFAVLPILLVVLYDQVDSTLQYAVKSTFSGIGWLICWRVVFYMILGLLLFTGSLYLKKIPYSKPLLIVICVNIAVCGGWICLPFAGFGLGAWVSRFNALATRSFQLLGLELGFLLCGAVHLFIKRKKF